MCPTKRTEQGLTNKGKTLLALRLEREEEARSVRRSTVTIKVEEDLLPSRSV
jgi:hypothetical protein